MPEPGPGRSVYVQRHEKVDTIPTNTLPPTPLEPAMNDLMYRRGCYAVY
jgi:hypothetical protein